MEFRIVERRTYIKDETGKRKILIEKISIKNKHTYKESIKGKVKIIQTTTYYNELKQAEKTLFEKKIEREVEITDEYEEYEYFIGFDYVTSRKAMIVKGKHDFKTEFRVSSPSKLTDNEIRSLIQTKFSDYGVLRNDNAYNIKSESKTTTKEKPSITVKFTSKIER